MNTDRDARASQRAGLMILVAGPYRSGTGDDPEKMAANVRAMEAYALPLFRAGHIPASKGADEMVRIARRRGLRVFHGLHEVPGCR